MYGVNPAGQVFQYDGSSLERIHTGADAAAGKPVAIAAHQNHLWVAYEHGSLMHSALGKPTNWSTAEGAAEIAVGDSITGLVPGYVGSLIVFGRSRIHVLYGTSAADWQRRELQGDTGSLLNSAMLMHVPVFFGDGGIRTLAAVETYGSLSLGLTSDQITPILQHKASSNIYPVAVMRVRKKSQYRLFFSDGETVVMTLYEDSRGQLRSAFTLSRYDLWVPFEADLIRRPGIVTACCSTSDPEDREERLFLAMRGSGFVYEMDRGNSFDGQPIEAFLTTAPNDLGTPGWLKQFTKFDIEASIAQESRVKLAVSFDDDTKGHTTPQARYLTSQAYWDQARWNDAEWDRMGLPVASARMYGMGRNVSVSVQSNGVGAPHTITGVTTYFEPRKVLR